MKLSKILVSVAMLASVATTQVQADKKHPFGMKHAFGARVSCGDWNVSRSQGTATYNSMFALGYLSGAVVWGMKGDPLANVSENGLDGWLDNYCRANPLSTLVDAMNILLHSLSKK
jgi:hypothetical protein